MHKILIVEDDEIIKNSIKQYIETWGLNATYVEDFKNVVGTFVTYDPQLVLLDISLPFFNGYHWCSELRKISKVPIIFISSASDNINIVMAMNMGADDFIAKPFDLNVLMAKVQALLRRTYDFGMTGHLIEHRGAIFNCSDNSLEYQGERIELTKNEDKILNLMLENKGKIMSRDVIMTRLWESDSFIDDNTLTVNVTRLRKKLDAVGLENFIHTKKGIGYIVE